MAIKTHSSEKSFVVKDGRLATIIFDPRSVITVCILEFRYPFSLFNAYNRLDGLKRVGNVEEVMDKQLGRRIVKVTGALCANNYIEFSNLELSGQFIYIQMKLLTKVATMHIDVLTTSEQSIRFSLSTLYNNEQPRFLGRSLRSAFHNNLCELYFTIFYLIRLSLPLETEWMIVSLNIAAILEKFCSPNYSSEMKLRCIQVCLCYLSYFSLVYVLPI